MDWLIEPLQPADWPEVRAVYLEGIASRNATFEVEAPDWQRWDAAHLPPCRLVARTGGRVAGWAALAAVSGRRCYAGVAEASVYVGARDAGRGAGSALLRALIEASERHGIWTLQAGIFPENSASLTLVRKFGFREVGRRDRIAQLDGVWRDVLLLERRSSVAGR